MSNTAAQTVDNDLISADGYEVIRRNGKVTGFDPSKISVAITKAFLAVEGDSAGDSRRIHETVEGLTEQIMTSFGRRMPSGGTIHIEDIQDQVELALMREGHHKTARAYVLYREEQARKRRQHAEQDATPDAAHTITLRLKDGTTAPLNLIHVQEQLTEACDGLADVSVLALQTEVEKTLYDGMSEEDVDTALIMAARHLLDKDPNYSMVTARLLLHSLRTEALTHLADHKVTANNDHMQQRYADYFADYIQQAVDWQLLDAELTRFDLKQLGQALQPERDLQFTYLGLQTLYDRYFIHHHEQRVELPQAFFMRVAMGLAINEIDREARAIEFYHVLSSFDFMSSTPTLFNSGTLRPQLSSCYLTTVPDDLEKIYGAIRDNALLSKYAGGLGNDWTPVRGLGAHIKGTNGKSQGVVPFLKVVNDTAVAVNQGGKRKGAVCSYLETWHIDIEEFLDLRKNTGDDRRRTHDMNTANWIPDLFMQRVADNGQWTLFSPNETPDLHDLYGEAFQQRYEHYEAKADRGEIQVFKRLSAVNLWRKMLGQLFETGHPWITFKDPCNLRYTNQHVGVVHSSNLCTEITLHTNDKEIAVCNLGSVNVAAHLKETGIDHAKLQQTITTAMRMLDNVVDYNFYAVPQARRSNLQHRPVGLGIMGFQDALYLQNLAYDSDAAVAFADELQEAVSYYAINASCELAFERGSYATYDGSLWSQGILPLDSLKRMKDYRADSIEVDTSERLDWGTLKHRIAQYGMRNSNCLAIAPTATISNICGVTQSIEPTYQNLYVKSNLSGEFTVMNPHLVNDLKALNLWDEVMINDLKYFDGSVQAIDRIPAELKAKYATAFEVSPTALIDCASRRQKWIDQAQSLNLYMAEASGPKLDAMYRLAWKRGLKTTYYLRTLGATHVEKSTSPQMEPEPKVCSILDPECEACQ